MSEPGAPGRRRQQRRRLHRGEEGVDVTCVVHVIRVVVVGLADVAARAVRVGVDVFQYVADAVVVAVPRGLVKVLCESQRRLEGGNAVAWRVAY
jgi:hypothetical protein